MRRLLLLLAATCSVLIVSPITRTIHPVLAPTPIALEPTPPLPARMISQEELQPLLVQAGQKYHVDQDLLASLLKVESGGQVNAVSRTGAQGLMQLMPGTAAEMGVTDSFVPAQSISGGAQYIRQLLQHFHDKISLAVAAYNAGPHAVERYHGIPPFRETRNYVKRVLGAFNQRKHEERLLALATRPHSSRVARG